ncbi:MAG TPA: hypothetical protein PLC54_01295 [Spirochaetales bacterium]|nr:hypothetical protein [Spirochaetales bacterium]
MSIFEIIMLACFGAAWPFSIYKSWTARKTSGKSIFFLFVVLAGYAAGIINKILYNPDPVMWMYALNALMVSVDIVLYFRNRSLERA